MADEAYLVDLTDAAAWLPTKFAPAVAGYWVETLRVAQAAQDYSGFVVPGAKAVTVPLVPLTAAVTKTSGTVLAYGDTTDTLVGTITLNTQKALSFLVEDIVQLQTNVDMYKAFYMAAGDALALELDYLCATTVKGETTNTAITTGTDNTITLANILSAQSTFNTQRIKLRNCAMGIAPVAFELSVASWGTAYTSANLRGDPAGSMYWNGIEGKLFGMQIFVFGDGTNGWTSGTTDECATIWHPRALGYATTGVKVVGPVPEPLYVGQGFTVHSIMGCTVMNAYGVLKIVND